MQVYIWPALHTSDSLVAMVSACVVLDLPAKVVFRLAEMFCFVVVLMVVIFVHDGSVHGSEKNRYAASSRKMLRGTEYRETIVRLEHAWFRSH